MMKNPFPSLAAWVVVTVSCIAWIAGISFTLVCFLGLSPQAGWIVAAVLGAPAGLAVGVFVYEMRHAIDLPGYIDPSEFNGLRPTLPVSPSVAKNLPVSAFRTVG